MPSFDVVSEVNMDEVANAVDQSNREVDTRFDFKGKDAKFSLEDSQITMRAPDEFQLNQMYDILTSKLAGRKVNIRSFGTRYRAGECKRRLANRSCAPGD